MIKQIDIVNCVSSMLTYFEIKEMIVDFSILAKNARVDKHVVGKTIRRRDYTKEEKYGKCKHALNILYGAKEAKEFSDNNLEFPEYIINKSKKELSLMKSFISENYNIIKKEKFNRIQGA